MQREQHWRAMSLLAITAAMVMALVVPAGAAGNEDTVPLDVTVNATCVLDVSTGSVSFGNVNAGVTSAAQNINYSVQSNVTSTIHVGYTARSGGSLGTGGEFQLNKGSGFVSVPATAANPGPSTGFSDWRTSVPSGTTPYQDTVRVIVGSNAPAGANVTQTLRYLSECS